MNGHRQTTLSAGGSGSGGMGSGGWMLALILSLLFSMVLGLGLVWLSIDRNDTAYTIQKMQSEADDMRAHVAKLEVERDSLLSPYVLGKKAEQIGMGMADPGQVRRLQVPHMSGDTGDSADTKNGTKSKTRQNSDDKNGKAQ